MSRPASRRRTGAAASASTTSAIRRSRSRSRAGRPPAPACTASRFDGRYLYGSPTLEGYRRQRHGHLRPEESGEAGAGRALAHAGAMDRRRRDADLEGDAPPLPSSAAPRQPALHQLLAGRLRHHRHRGHGEAEVRLRPRLVAAVPVPDPQRDPGAVRDRRPQDPAGRRRGRDAPVRRDRRRSSGSSTSPRRTGRCRSRRSRSRSSTARRSPKHSAAISRSRRSPAPKFRPPGSCNGMRIIDIGRPRAPKEVARFVPDPPPGFDHPLSQRRVRGRPRADLPARPRARVPHPGADVGLDAGVVRAQAGTQMPLRRSSGSGLCRCLPGLIPCRLAARNGRAFEPRVSNLRERQDNEALSF